MFANSKVGKTADTLLFLYIHLCPKGSSKKPHFRPFGLIPPLTDFPKSILFLSITNFS